MEQPGPALVPSYLSLSLCLSPAIAPLEKNDSADNAQLNRVLVVFSAFPGAQSEIGLLKKAQKRFLFPFHTC